MISYGISLDFFYVSILYTHILTYKNIYVNNTYKKYVLNIIKYYCIILVEVEYVQKK